MANSFITSSSGKYGTRASPQRARAAIVNYDGMSLRYNVWELQFMYLFINFMCLFIYFMCLFIYFHMDNLCILEVFSSTYTYQMLCSFRRGGGGGGADPTGWE